MSDSFSQRHGLAGPPPGTLFRDKVPVSFKMFLVDLPSAIRGIEYHELRRLTCEVLQAWPDENLPPYYEYKRRIQECEWFRIYEIIESIYTLLSEKDRGSFNYYAGSFVTAVNDAFVAQNIGWQLDYDGKVVTRGDEAFERTVNTAAAVLEESSKPTAARHLHFAISALSTRPNPNTSGAVALATNAVECVLGEITGKAMTLGKYLDKYPDLFHSSLKKGLDGIYGYASDEGARHGKEGTEPTLEEAEFTVATCAAVCTLLVRKHPK
jgi:AbiJ N-terminal domain 4